MIIIIIITIQRIMISTIIMQRIMTCAGLHSSISKSRHWGSEPPSQTCVMMRVVFMGFVVFMVLMIFMIFMVSMMIVSPLSGHSCTRSPVGVRSRKPTIHTLIIMHCGIDCLSTYTLYINSLWRRKKIKISCGDFNVLFENNKSRHTRSFSIESLHTFRPTW